MTPTLLFWIRIGAIALIAYTLYTMIRPMVKRGYALPRARKEWGSLLSDLFSLGAGFFLLFILQRNYSEPMEAVMKYKGKELPEFSYINTNSGLEERLAYPKGKVVILNIWATWCPPCRVEMPELDKLQKAYPDKVSVIAVSDESLDKVRQFSQTHPYSFTTAVFSHSNELLNSINSRPVSILISDGKVKDIVVGARGYSFFSDWFLSFVE